MRALNAPATTEVAAPAATVRRALRVGSTTDPAEVEADAVADRVMRMTAVDTLHRCPCGGGDPEEVRRHPTDDLHDERIRARSATGASGGILDADTADRVTAARTGGDPLAPALRTFFEPRFGTDLSHVRTHTDAPSQRLAADVNARAFTTGHHIIFGAGEHQAHTPTHLVAHELTHTLQPAGASCTPQTAIRRRVRPGRVSCRNARPGSRILTRINTADPVGTIQAADAAAIRMLDTVIDTLVTNRDAVRGGAPVAWPTIGDATARALRTRLGLDPNDPAIWTGNGARTVNTVIRRFQGARRLLVGGGLSYQCMGSPSVSSHSGCSGPDCTAGDDASTCPPSRLVVLCDGFWGYDNADDRGLVLLHEAMHIFFDVVGDTGRFANAGCYDQLIGDLHGLADAGVCP